MAPTGVRRPACLGENCVAAVRLVTGRPQQFEAQEPAAKRTKRVTSTPFSFIS